MKHKGKYTTPQLRDLAHEGRNVFPVFGRSVDMITLSYSPRTKFDPKPWVWGDHRDGFRYSAWELTVSPLTARPGDLIEQRHAADLDGTDAAFTHMYDKDRAGVAA